MMKNLYLSGIIICCVFFAGGCNRGGEITKPAGPVITMDDESHVYRAKVGREITITPQVANSEGASYTWETAAGVISQLPELRYTFVEAGSVNITFRVETSAGSDKVELRIDVSEPAPPVISFAVPSGGVEVAKGSGYLFSPDVQNGDDARFAWYLDGRKVGGEKEYLFSQAETGIYELKMTAANDDGEDEKSVRVAVVDALTIEITFPAPMWNANPLQKFVPRGRTLFLRPYVRNTTDPVYSWSVDGVDRTGEEGRMFAFAPDQEGMYTVTFTVMDGGRMASTDVIVTCCGAESTLIKAVTGNTSWNRVYEYLPAPGQFINDPETGGFAGEDTFAEAAGYAAARLTAKRFVSLGGFGGYIIVGFDHSIQNKGGYDFSITGNQSGEGSEPGVVWVMQDTNGNGQPDDEWYELRGSEHGKPETVQEYYVTYYRPAGRGMDVRWTDNLGGEGRIDYLKAYHAQDHYYPAWMAESSYTLHGTRLESRTTAQSGGIWRNGAFDWGYADNMGDDMLTSDGNPDAQAVKVYFKISNAVNPDASAANLQYIDFIKVQTGVNSKAGWLGENSTEVIGFEDENI